MFLSLITTWKREGHKGGREKGERVGRLGCHEGFRVFVIGACIWRHQFARPSKEEVEYAWCVRLRVKKQIEHLSKCEV